MPLPGRGARPARVEAQVDVAVDRRVRIAIPGRRHQIAARDPRVDRRVIAAIAGQKCQSLNAGLDIDLRLAGEPLPVAHRTVDALQPVARLRAADHVGPDADEHVVLRALELEARLHAARRIDHVAVGNRRVDPALAPRRAVQAQRVAGREEVIALVVEAHAGQQAEVDQRRRHEQVLAALAEREQMYEGIG
ncbi:MAG TPA: hypothetical protein VLM79_37550, partial [Kofleriaceae bacterium]|nr:hypothetical protein [Kofleriaceae bacterium]